MEVTAVVTSALLLAPSSASPSSSTDVWMLDVPFLAFPSCSVVVSSCPSVVSSGKDKTPGLHKTTGYLGWNDCYAQPETALCLREHPLAVATTTTVA